MAIDIVGEDLYWNDAPTYTAAVGWPAADPRLAGLLLNHRVINGIFDDRNPSHDYDGDGRDDWAFPDLGHWDPDENTRRFLAAMPAWREAGVLGFTIGLQAGNPFASSPPPPGMAVADVDSGAFRPDGTLRPAFLARLARILDAAAALGLVPIVNYFYQGAIHRLAEDAIPAALENATRWLLEHGCDRLLIDVANECGARNYPLSLQPTHIGRMIARVRQAVGAYNRETGAVRRFFVGTSLLASWSIAERVQDLPEGLIEASDLLLPHGNKRTTAEMREGARALRARVRQVRGEGVPIVYNEDTQASAGPGVDVGGDLEHLEACLDLHASWGNLIRSHQRVPCADWAGGTEVQRAWLERARRLSQGARSA